MKKYLFNISVRLLILVVFLLSLGIAGFLFLPSLALSIIAGIILYLLTGDAFYYIKIRGDEWNVTDIVILPVKIALNIINNCLSKLIKE